MDTTEYPPPPAVLAALSALLSPIDAANPVAPKPPRASPQSLMAGAGVLEEWMEMASRLADVGLPGISSQAATDLLRDALSVPNATPKTGMLSPSQHANLDWKARCEWFAHDFAQRHGDKLFAGYSRPGGPYVTGVLQARIKALAGAGADLAACGALRLAVKNGEIADLEAVLALPGCPSPGHVDTQGSKPPGRSALHQIFLEQPLDKDAFMRLAAASRPADWLAPNRDGQIPAEVAIWRQPAQIARAAISMTPWGDPRLGPDSAGDTLTHRLASQRGYAAARPLLDEVLALYGASRGPGIFRATNHLGQAPCELAPSPLSRAYFEERLADAEQRILRTQAVEPGGPARAPGRI